MLCISMRTVGHDAITRVSAGSLNSFGAVVPSPQIRTHSLKRYRELKKTKEVEARSPRVFGPLIGCLRVHGSLAFERACGYRAAYRHLETAQDCPEPL